MKCECPCPWKKCVRFILDGLCATVLAREIKQAMITQAIKDRNRDMLRSLLQR